MSIVLFTVIANGTSRIGSSGSFAVAVADTARFDCTHDVNCREQL